MKTLVWLALATFSMPMMADQTWYDSDMNVRGYEVGGQYYDDNYDYQGHTTGYGTAYDEDGDYAGQVYGNPDDNLDAGMLLIYPD